MYVVNKTDWQMHLFDMRGEQRLSLEFVNIPLWRWQRVFCWETNTVFILRTHQTTRVIWAWDKVDIPPLDFWGILLFYLWWKFFYFYFLMKLIRIKANQ